MNDIAAADRFDKIDAQLDRISKVMIKGFDRIDKTLKTKAKASDLQNSFRAAGYTR